jgi:hypothetical protein
MFPESAIARRCNTLLNPVLAGGTLLLSFLATLVARAIRRQFIYKYDEDDRHRLTRYGQDHDNSLAGPID